MNLSCQVTLAASRLAALVYDQLALCRVTLLGGPGAEAHATPGTGERGMDAVSPTPVPVPTEDELAAGMRAADALLRAIDLPVSPRTLAELVLTVLAAAAHAAPRRREERHPLH